MLRTPFHVRDGDEPNLLVDEKHLLASPIKKPIHIDDHHGNFLHHHHAITSDDLGNLAIAASASQRALISNNSNYFDNTVLVRAKRQLARDMERNCLPNIALFQNNQDILPTMRCKLINWIIEVSLHFRFHRETLFLAIHYLDRFLSLHWGVSRNSLQLIGVACLFIAAKLEEIYPPKLKDFSKVCDGSCSTRSIFSTELDVLMTIQWRLNVPTAYFWLGLYLDLLKEHLDGDAIQTLRTLSLEIVDLAIHTPIVLLYRYSLVAASALYLRLNDLWLVSHCSEYTWEELEPCVEWLHGLFSCPDCIVYYDPKETADVAEEEFDEAIQANSRAMKSLMEHIRNGSI